MGEEKGLEYQTENRRGNHQESLLTNDLVSVKKGPTSVVVLLLLLFFWIFIYFATAPLSNANSSCLNYCCFFPCIGLRVKNNSFTILFVLFCFVCCVVDVIVFFLFFVFCFCLFNDFSPSAIKNVCPLGTVHYLWGRGAGRMLSCVKKKYLGSGHYLRQGGMEDF